MDTHSKDKFADNNVTETVHPIDKRVGNNVKSRREHLGIGTVQLAQEALSRKSAEDPSRNIRTECGEIMHGPRIGCFRGRQL